MDDLGFECQQEQEVFLSSKPSRSVLGLTQLLIPWVPGVLSQGINRSGLEVDDSSLSSAEVKNKWGYNSTPRYMLHGLGRDFTYFFK
jgi:hypothetical protein